MIPIIQILALFLSILSCLSSYAFTFNEKPIDASCFYNLDKDTHSIDLRQCGLKQHKFVRSKTNTNLIAQGYTGFDWKDPANKLQGYSYYKYFKAADNSYWLFSLNNGGGNAEMTDLYWVKQENSHVLKIQQIRSGNRCNGGIQQVQKEKGRLRFHVNLTAFDLFALSKHADKSIKAYDDLAACAVCCVAKAVYEMKDENPKLVYVDLGDQTNPQEMPNQGQYQACFNKLFTSAVRQGKHRLDPAALNQFVLEFNKICKHSKS